MMVLLSNRNSLDSSFWDSAPFAPTEVFDSFKWPLVLELVSL